MTRNRLICDSKKGRNISADRWGLCGSARVDANQLNNPGEFVADERKPRDINAVSGTRQAELSRQRRCLVLFHRLGSEHTNVLAMRRCAGIRQSRDRGV